MINSKIKSQIKNLVPPIIYKKLIQRINASVKYEGNFSSWEDAAKGCSGYENAEILAKVLSATIKVKNGEAAYERDSVLFEKIEYSWPVTAALMWSAARHDGRLNVIDFGGSLGSSYFQNRNFLRHLKEVNWSVIEQKHFVEAGNKYIRDNVLSFYENVDDSLVNVAASVVLFSSVLQYIPDPYKLLDSVLSINPEIIIIDRTPFLNDLAACDVLKVQKVPAVVYSASYPCWFFSKKNLIQYISSKGYRLVESFISMNGESEIGTWQGMIFTKDD